MKFSRISWGVCGSLLLAALLFTSCDDRNEADIPAQVYRLAANYTTDYGAFGCVDVDDHYAVVAQGARGLQVLDFTTLSNTPPVVFDFVVDRGTSLTALVAINRAQGLVASLFDLNNPHEFFGNGFVMDIAAPGIDSIAIGFQTPISELRFVVDPSGELFRLWGGDRAGGDGLYAKTVCYNGDSGQWSSTNCPDNSTPYIPPRDDNVRGFEIKDSLFAVAIDVDGVHIMNPFDASIAGDIETPGIAYDCAWYGDYIIVADQYFVTVLNAADPNEPEVVSNLIIDSADRLHNVEVDGHYACLLDEFDGIYVVDLTDLTALKVVQELRLNEPTWIASEEGRIYVTDEQRGLLVYNRD